MPDEGSLWCITLVSVEVAVACRRLRASTLNIFERLGASGFDFFFQRFSAQKLEENPDISFANSDTGTTSPRNGGKESEEAKAVS